MRIVISSGHGKYIRGASDIIDEVDEARRVVNQVASLIGANATVFHDDTSHSQDENLKRICSFHNSTIRDLDVSVHFNATPGAHGTEVYHITQQSLAQRVCDSICKSGFTNRGAKDGSNLYFLNHTSQPAILIEVCFVDSQSDCDLYKKKFHEICLHIAEALTGETIISEDPPFAPSPPSSVEGPPPTLKKGSQGPQVVVLQKLLGVLAEDGDFGPTTDTWVRAFQGSNDLSQDGIVGPETWGTLHAMDDLKREGEPPIPNNLADQIYTLAQQSEIADYSWKDRGVAPPGFIAGLALSFAYALSEAGEATSVMCRSLRDPDTDALAWLNAEFKAQGMSNQVPGTDCLRHTFVLLIGLGPRESSGRYFEGRDMSATNVSSDTCEAGMFQTSWNIRSSSSAIPPLLKQFWMNPNGFLEVFKEGLTPSANNLNSYGSGDGLKYQFLSRYCPLFHVMVTGVGTRCLRQHWGPINRKELEIKREADHLLQEVQELMEDQV